MSKQRGRFSFDCILDEADAAVAAHTPQTSFHISASTTLLLRILLREAPLWVVFCHPDRPANDAHRLIRALGHLYRHGAHHHVREADGHDLEKTTAATDEDAPLPTPNRPGHPREPHRPSPTGTHHTMSRTTATRTTTVASEAQEEETKLILALLGAHATTPTAAHGEAQNRPATGVSPAQHLCSSTSDDTAPPSPPLVGQQLAHTPFVQRWAALGLTPPLFPSRASASLKSSLSGSLDCVDVVPVTLDLLRRSPSWYTSLLRPRCVRALDAQLNILSTSVRLAEPESSAVTAIEASHTLLKRWYILRERDTWTRPSATSTATQPTKVGVNHNEHETPPRQMCFVLAPALLPSRFSTEACALALRQICQDVRAAQASALEAAASQVVDRRVALTLPALDASVRRKRPRTVDCEQEQEVSTAAAPVASDEPSGLLGWAASLKAEADAMPQTATNHRDAWVQAVRAAVPCGVGLLILAAKPSSSLTTPASASVTTRTPLQRRSTASAVASTSASLSSHGEGSLHALALDAQFSTFLLVQ